MKHVISLGAGVQSSVMALMASRGEIGPMPAVAVFADTHAEPASFYTWLDWLEQQLAFPVVRLDCGNLEEDAKLIHISKKTGLNYIKPFVPLYTSSSENNRGKLLRQCTEQYKIRPIQRYCKRYRYGRVSMWLGISTDEAHRQTESKVPWIDLRYPLIDLEMSRDDCLKWLDDNGYPRPAKSSCVFCPYHSDRDWLRLKNEEPEEFERAVQFERDVRASMAQITRINYDGFLHKARVPLDEVQFKDEPEPNAFGNECSGMCGV